jgi:hypothetical protein
MANKDDLHKKQEKIGKDREIFENFPIFASKIPLI